MSFAVLQSVENLALPISKRIFSPVAEGTIRAGQGAEWAADTTLPWCFLCCEQLVLRAGVKYRVKTSFVLPSLSVLTAQDPARAERGCFAFGSIPWGKVVCTSQIPYHVGKYFCADTIWDTDVGTDKPDSLCCSSNCRVFSVMSHFQGYLPENKFNRILTEPVLRDTGPRRRGRRPRSELLKGPGVVADSSSGMGPLFMNGLIAGMDLVGLQNMRNMQGIPLTGLVGFPAGFAAVPAGEDVKSTLSMLPMMLPGMATVPQMFGVGGLLNSPMTTTCTATAPTSLTSTTKGGTASAEKANEEKQGSQDGKKEPLAEDKPGPSSFSNQTESAITTSSPVAFNPFLIPGMSPGLIYPSMFLSPGIGMALPGIQQTRHSEAANLESQKRKRKKAKGESANPEPETVSLPEKEAANSQNCVEQSPPAAAEKEQDGAAEEEHQAAHDTD